jgi:hypothetical protein
MRRNQKSLIDQVRDIDSGFADEVYALTTEALKEKVISLDKYALELEEAKKADPDLAAKREAVKTANESYAEPLKASKLKRKLIFQILQERAQS